jgi:inosose dehydratase
MTEKLRLGTAPDSWGVWFPNEPAQVPWDRFLDEVAQAGYEWIELGPYGYLPTNPTQLRDELDRRGLKLSGGAVLVRCARPNPTPGLQSPSGRLPDERNTQ